MCTLSSSVLRRILVALAIVVALIHASARAQEDSTHRGRPGERASAGAKQLDFNSSIQHIVFIIKENRSFDSYFGTYPNADGATSGIISTGETIPLLHAGDRYPRDFNHSWDATVQSIDYGRMDDFDLPTQYPCTINGDYLCYSQVYQQDIPNYWAYAQNYVLGDETFSAESGPSYPQHIFAIAASSGGVIGDPVIPTGDSPGCDAPPGFVVEMLNTVGNTYYQYPCYDMQTLGDTLDAAGIQWKSYTDIESNWNGFLSISHIRHSSDWTNNIVKSSDFETDIATGQLPAVSWLIADNIQSEHPINGVCWGENWTVQQINAIMNSPYWSNTAIFVTWDDSDGLYDHVPPPVEDEYGLGPRVPLLIISPYAQYAPGGYISHTVYEPSSILKFIEERFNLPYLTNRDANANDMLDSFDFTQSPLPPLTLTARTCPVASQTSTSFLPEQVGATSPSRSILVTNFTPETLIIHSITTNGEFGQTNNCGGTIKSYEGAGVPPYCTINVTFSPTAAGPQTGTLTITDSASGSPQVVQLSGTGTNIELSPSLLSFGIEMVGATSAPKMATLTNSGSAPATIDSITGTADYPASSNCGSTVPAQGMCTITVAFSPTAAGKRYGPLTVTTSDAGSPQIVNLTGVGTAVSLDPTSLNFGNQPVGSPSAPRNVMLTNDGSTPLEISSISFVGDTGKVPGEATEDFSQTNNCGSTVSPGGKCTLMVVFDPTGLHARDVDLNINDSFGDSPQQVTLTGTGTAPLRNAVPFVQSLAPVSAAPGSPSLQLALNGAAFVAGATVDWNGTPLSTTYQSTHSLTATVPASLLAGAGTAQVTAVNVTPGGGGSSVRFFSVVNPESSVAFNRTDVSVGTAPQGIVGGDFNGDGIEDLAIADSGANTLSVLLGNGGGTFTAQPSPTTGREPVSLAAGDFNNDGKLDVAVGNLMDNTVEILLGNGNGTFTAAASVASTVWPVSIAAGDFNQDGNLDVAVANDLEPTISILLGAGDGTLANTTTPPGAGSDPSAAVLGDFNEDGYLDVAEVNNADLTLAGILGNGDGTFHTVNGTPAETGRNPIAMTAGDFNGDGFLDVSVANQIDSTISVFLGNGDGAFQAGQTYATGAGPSAIAAADLNGDGVPDLVTANATASTISLLLGGGAGTFGAHTDFPTGAGPAGLAVADFNGDGRPDVVVTNNAANTVSVLLQSGAGAPAVQFSPLSLTFATQLVNSASPGEAVTLTNSGVTGLTITSISIGGSNAGDFSQSNTCGSGLNAGASCTITVTFDPVAPGSRSADVSVSDNAPGSPQSVPLAGTGTVMQFVPGSLSFGSVNVGSVSSPQTVTVTNTGATAVSITGINKAGADRADFSVVSDTCRQTLAAGGSCVATLTFKPAATGERTAILSFTDSGGGSPQTVKLSGTGT
jgi:phospholipase C